MPAIATADESDKDPVTVNVPLEIVVMPVYELAPDNVQVPVPVLVSPPVVVPIAPAIELPVDVPSKVKV